MCRERVYIGYVRVCEKLIVALERLKDNIVGRLEMFLEMFDCPFVFILEPINHGLAFRGGQILLCSLIFEGQTSYSVGFIRLLRLTYTADCHIQHLADGLITIAEEC